MAAGEYISMQSQRELFERQIELERAELEAMPAEEQAELAALYIARRVSRKPKPSASPSGCSANPERRSTRSSARSWASTPTSSGRHGARRRLVRGVRGRCVVPVVPYLFGGGSAAFVASLGLSLVALFAVGAAVSLLTGRGLMFSGMRQVAIGAAAAAVTYAVGSSSAWGSAGERRHGRSGGPRARLRREGLHPGLVERPARPLRRPRARVRQGARVRAGSIRFGLPATGTRAELRAGDRLELPAGTRHDADVGPDGRDMPRGACAGGPLTAFDGSSGQPGGHLRSAPGITNAPARAGA